MISKQYRLEKTESKNQSPISKSHFEQGWACQKQKTQNDTSRLCGVWCVYIEMQVMISDKVPMCVISSQVSVKVTMCLRTVYRYWSSLGVGVPRQF